MSLIMYLFRFLLPDINDCVNHTCENGGSCVDGVNNYSCNCLVGFTGQQCQIGKFLLSLWLLLLVFNVFFVNYTFVND